MVEGQGDAYQEAFEKDLAAYVGAASWVVEEETCPWVVSPVVQVVHHYEIVVEVVEVRLLAGLVVHSLQLQSALIQLYMLH